MKSTNVTVRVDEETKRDFDNFCENVGINITTAFNMFIRATLRTRELPFAVTDIQTRVAVLSKGKEAFKEAQFQSAINGTSNMTMGDIEAEIMAHRQEKSTIR